jgi:predicted dehydrogenase
MHVLVIGGGSIGEQHARCFFWTSDDVSLCDVRPEMRERLAQTYPLRQTFAYFHEALTSWPDVSVICTRAHLHDGMAIDLVNAGWHILSEIVVCTSIDRVDELMQLMKEKKTAFAIAYMLRCHPIIAAMREAIQGSRFVKPVELIAVTGQPFPTLRPAYRGTYRTNRATRGGCLQDALAHIVNDSEWIFGPITRFNSRSRSSGARRGHRRRHGLRVGTTRSIACHVARRVARDRYPQPLSRAGGEVTTKSPGRRTRRESARSRRRR